MATTGIRELRLPASRSTRIVAVIPAYNEAATLGEVVQRTAPHVHQVLVVNDGSSDRTEAVAQAAGAVVVSHGSNRGLGPTFRTGIQAALASGADVVVVIDADGQFDPAHVPQLVEPILAGRCDVVTATRFGSVRMRGAMPLSKRFGNRLFTGVTNLVTGLRLTDTQCGYRAYSREAAARLTTFGQRTYTQEALIDLAYKGLRIEEIPLPVEARRRSGKSRVAANVIGYGVRALGIILKTVRDHKPGPFFAVVGIGFALAAAALLLVPHPAAPFGAAALAASGIVSVLLGQASEMSARNRRLLEAILYRLQEK